MANTINTKFSTVHVTGDNFKYNGQSIGAVGEYSAMLNGCSIAKGEHSIATGKNTVAIGNYSASFGIGTVSTEHGMMSVGRYNLIDTSEDSLFAVGNGTSEARSTAFTVKTNKVESTVPIYYIGNLVATSADLSPINESVNKVINKVKPDLFTGTNEGDFVVIGEDGNFKPMTITTGGTY